MKLLLVLLGLLAAVLGELQWDQSGQYRVVDTRPLRVGYVRALPAALPYAAVPYATLPGPYPYFYNYQQFLKK